MKRVSPRQHLRIDERFRAADAETRDMNVMIDEPRRIDVVESAFDEVGRFYAEIGIQLFRLFRERAADGMDQTHLIYIRVQSSSSKFRVQALACCFGNNEQPEG